MGKRLSSLPPITFLRHNPIKAYWQIWKSIDAEIKTIEQELKKQAQSDPNEKIYSSSPGIGSVSARVLSNELGDMSQFANERQLFSYTGLNGTEIRRHKSLKCLV